MYELYNIVAIFGSTLTHVFHISLLLKVTVVTKAKQSS